MFPTLAPGLSPTQRMALIPIDGTDVHRSYDRLTGRLRAAEFTFNTLLSRASELRKVMSNEPASASTSTSTPKDHMPPLYGPPAPGSASHSNSKSRPPSLSCDLPPTPPTPNIDPDKASFLPYLSPSNNPESSPFSTDWAQRCTAYYAKRKLQEEAKKARIASQANAPSYQSSFHGSHPHARAQPRSSSQPPPPPQTPHPQRRPHEPARGRDEMRKAAISVSAWNAYTRGWDLITNTLGNNNNNNNNASASGLKSTPMSPSPNTPSPPPFLSMSSIPWPILRIPLDGEVDYCDFTSEDIREFLLSPYHSPNKPKEVRIREAYLRWHPDKAGKWMASVVPSDRVRVKQAVDKVAWCLNQLK
jgi:hypothetical protein